MNQLPCGPKDPKYLIWRNLIIEKLDKNKNRFANMSNKAGV